MACSTVWKYPKHSVKLSGALFDLSMWSLNSDLESWHSSSPPQLTAIFPAATGSRRDASMEREGFVFTACNSILFFPGGVERSSTGCHAAHTKVQVCRRGAGAEQESCLVGFPPSPQPALGLTNWQKSPVAFGSWGLATGWVPSALHSSLSSLC